MKLLALAVGLAAVAAIVATIAAGATKQQLTLHVSQKAKIGHSGSTLTIKGSVSCKAQRFFALSLEGVEPKTRASVHGAVPALGQQPPTCKTARKSFTLVATQEGQKKPIALTRGTFRACLFIRSWRPHTAVSLNARCFTLRASRS